MARLLALLASVALLATTACSSIRPVQVTKVGGVIALEGSRDGAREKAIAYMKDRCALGYEIVEEGEAVVGSDTYQVQRPNLLGPDKALRTKELREWRIVYRCQGTTNAAVETLRFQVL